MVLEGEARDRRIGLRLEIGREDAVLGGGRELRHPPAFEQVRDERGDEDGLAGAAEAGHAEADHRLPEDIADVGDGALDGADETAGHPVEIQGALSSFSRVDT